MLTIVIISACIAVLFVIGLVIFFVVRKRKNTDTIIKNWDTKVVDGTLNLSDSVEYLKSLPITQERHIPFVANALKMEGVKDLVIKKFPNSEKDVFFIFLGVYTKGSDEIEFGQLIKAKAIDDELKSILGDKEFVVLS